MRPQQTADNIAGNAKSKKSLEGWRPRHSMGSPGDEAPMCHIHVRWFNCGVEGQRKRVGEGSFLSLHQGVALLLFPQTLEAWRHILPPTNWCSCVNVERPMSNRRKSRMAAIGPISLRLYAPAALLLIPLCSSAAARDPSCGGLWPASQLQKQHLVWCHGKESQAGLALWPVWLVEQHLVAVQSSQLQDYDLET